MKRFKSITLLEVLVWMVITSMVLLSATQIIYSLNDSTIQNSKINKSVEGVSLLNSMLLSEFTRAGELPSYSDSLKKIEFSNGNQYFSQGGIVYVKLSGNIERELFNAEFKELSSRALSNGYEYKAVVVSENVEYDLNFFYASSQY